MADSLRLLFELDVDPRAGVAGLQRFRKDIAATIAATRKALTQSFTLPPIKLPTVTAATGGRGQADAHVREFRRLEAEAKRSAKAQETEQKRLNSAVQSLQRQRSAAIIAGWKAEERAAAASLRAQERAAQQASRAIVKSFRDIGRGIGPGLQSIGRTLSIGVTAPLLALGAASLKSAKDIDANVNTLKAFTGSAEAAERRLAELIKTARGTPGLTTNLALTLDAQLRTAQVTEETINRVLPAIGRLNAVSRLPDVGRFTQNLLQLVTQNFERQDLKELVGQSPIAGQLIRELFNVDSPTNTKAIREQAQKLGLTTVDSFFAALAEAAQRNQGLANVTESIGTRFEKAVDRVTVALRPLGLAIINAIEPFIEPVAKLIERIGDAFNSLSAPVKTAIIVIAGIAAAVGPVLFVLGSLASAVENVIAAVSVVGAAIALVGFPELILVIGGLVIVIGEWVAILGALGLAWKTNFLNIRDLTADAASAVLQAFSRIKAVFDEATQRILPTLQSITTKVLGVITLAWDKYGKDIVRVVGASFRFISGVLEVFLTQFTNFVDLLLKLIDGDFRGAWAAFARIHITALEAFQKFLDQLGPLMIRAFGRLHVIILAESIRLAQLGTVLGVEIAAAIAKSLVAAHGTVRDALIEMLVLAVAGIDPTTIASVFVAKFIAALKKAAGAGVTIPVTVTPGPTVGADVGAGAGLFRPKKPPPPGDKDKGADAETRRRIRLLELEAERAEAIARQRISAENIFFEQRKTSLKDFTDFQIKEEEIVLEKKKAVFAAERAEAEKLTKGRDLALGEIRLKELKAELDFQDRRNQLLANQQREELEATKAHRQAVLDIQDEGDRKRLELIDSYVERYLISYEEAEKRRLKIEQDARDRRRVELESQLSEAGRNVEEQQRIKDAIAKLDAESATAKEEAENRKRRALRATLEAERDYYDTLHRITLRAAQLAREAAGIQLQRLIDRLGDRRRFRLRALELERRANEEDHRERLRQIEQEKQDAEKRLEGVRDAEEKLLKLREYYRKLEKAERKRRAEEQKKEDQDERKERDPFDPLKKAFDRFRDAVKHSGDSIKESIGSIVARVGEAAQSMVDALRQGIVAWILYSESLGKALKAALAQQLAVLAAEFAIQALKHGAYALGSLAFGNFIGAAKHAAAAAAFLAAAAATGVAARSLARSAGLHNRGGSASTASAAVAGGAPQNREFNYGGQAVEPSSAAAREGSAGAGGRTPGIFGVVADLAREVKQARLDNAALTAKLDGTLSRIGSLPPGDVVTIGAESASAAIGAATIQHGKENNDYYRELATNMGF